MRPCARQGQRPGQRPLAGADEDSNPDRGLCKHRQGVRSALQLDKEVRAAYDRPKTIYRHQQLIREWLQVEPYYGNLKARRLAAGTALRVALMIDDPVDIVNSMLGELQRERIELPAYSTLDRFADRAHAAADRRLFGWVMRHISDELRTKLDGLLLVESDQRLSAFQALRSSAKNATLAHLEELLSHLQWLESLGPMDQVLTGIASEDSFLCTGG